MGFDLYGMNPQADTPEPKWTKGEPFREVINTGNSGKEKAYEIIYHIKIY